VTHQESLESKVNETKATVKFQLKKVLCMGVAVGNCGMEEKQIFQNVQMSVNFLVSLLKKNWQNVCVSMFRAPVKFCAYPCLMITDFIWHLIFVSAGEMPVPEEHYGKGVPCVLNPSVRLVEFPGDLITGVLFAILSTIKFLCYN
jgi:hypothetical protein